MKETIPPSHPGEILKEMLIKDHKPTVTKVAEGLRISRVNLSALVNERAGINPEPAIKLSEAFGSTAPSWINLQKNYEL